MAERVLPLDVARAVFPVESITQPPVAEAIDVDIVTTARPAASRSAVTDLRALAPSAHNYR
jgi:hypothetical protein